MRPRHRNKRILLVLAIGSALVAGTGFLMSALNDNTQFFYNPSEVVASDFIPESDEFRIGGIVNPGTVTQTGDLTIAFEVIDFVEDFDGSPLNDAVVPVRYTGVVPDLFQEGKGVVVGGSLEAGLFVANEVLAKHDENYQPKKD